jgi:hypothetical protein
LLRSASLASLSMHYDMHFESAWQLNQHVTAGKSGIAFTDKSIGALKRPAARHIERMSGRAIRASASK